MGVVGTRCIGPVHGLSDTRAEQGVKRSGQVLGNSDVLDQVQLRLPGAASLVVMQSMWLDCKVI